MHDSKEDAINIRFAEEQIKKLESVEHLVPPDQKSKYDELIGLYRTGRDTILARYAGQNDKGDA